MAHQVLSRKYRPQRFADLVGQEHVARILTNALGSERVGHAYLFVGPRGVGKTTTARIFARALNCSGRVLAAGAVEPCGTCPSCRDIAAGSDYDVVEMDAASNNHVEDVRTLREQVGYATVRSPHRIWIVDEVHMLSLPAFNAFLKTLEEPPEAVTFLFCTTEEHKLPDTFRSRCQRVAFRPIDARAMAARLVELAAQEGAALSEEVAASIASGALGGLRDGESLLEQLLAACPSGEIALDDLDALAGRAPAARLETLAAAVEARDAGAALEAVDACLATGCKPGVLMDQWLDRFRATLVRAAQEGRSVAALARSIDVLLAKRQHLRTGADGVLVCQVAAVELARLPDARDLDELVGALRGRLAGPATRAGRAPRAQRAATAEEREPEPSPAGGATPRGAASAAPPRAASGVADGPGRSRAAEAPDEHRVRACWPAFVEAIAERDARLGAVLRQLAPHAVENGRVHLRAHGDVPTARAMFARREIQIALSQVARRTFGGALACVLDDVEAVPQRGDEDGPDLSGHPVVAMVTEATRGRLLDVERRARCAGAEEGAPGGDAEAGSGARAQAGAQP